MLHRQPRDTAAPGSTLVLLDKVNHALLVLLLALLFYVYMTETVPDDSKPRINWIKPPEGQTWDELTPAAGVAVAEGAAGTAE